MKDLTLFSLLFLVTQHLPRRKHPFIFLRPRRAFLLNYSVLISVSPVTQHEPLPTPTVKTRSTATNGILDYSCNSNAYKTKGKTLFNNFKTFDKDSTVANCGTSRFYFLPRLMMGVLVIGVINEQ